VIRLEEGMPTTWPAPAADRVEPVAVAYADRFPAWGHRKVAMLMRVDGHRAPDSTVLRALKRSGRVQPVDYQAERRQLAEAPSRSLFARRRLLPIALNHLRVADARGALVAPGLVQRPPLTPQVPSTDPIGLIVKTSTTPGCAKGKFGAVRVVHTATANYLNLEICGFQIASPIHFERVARPPAIRRWLVRHPRFVLHFIPKSSSWLNLVERWFAELTTKKLHGVDPISLTS